MSNAQTIVGITVEGKFYDWPETIEEQYNALDCEIAPQWCADRRCEIGHGIYETDEEREAWTEDSEYMQRAVADFLATHSYSYEVETA